MLKVTTRYLASSFITPFVMGLVFFIAFLITFYMFRIIDLIINKGVESTTILLMVINLGISFLPLATPLAAFFATFYTLSKLSEDSEIIAMRSFGMTKIKIYFPFLIASLLIGGTVITLQSVFIPKADAAFKNTIVRLTSSGMLASIKSEQFFTEIPNVTLFAKGVSENGNNFYNIFLHLDDKKNFEQKTIFAENGSLIKIYSNFGSPDSIRLHLKKGNIIKTNESGNQIEKVLFKEYDFPIFNADSALGMVHYDSMKTNTELLENIEQKKLSYYENYVPQKTVNEMLELKKTLYRTQTELCTRYVNLSQIVLFVFLGFCLGIKRGRGHGGSNSSRTIILIIAYYVLYFYLLSLAHAAVLNPAVAIFGPSFLFFIIGAKFYKKLDWAD